MSFAPGQALGNYRILSQIGVGGMGMVYLAEHPLIGKKVALKVIHHELSRNKEVVARFFREAKAVNTIGNEHIVEINDFGQTADGDHFLIMEYLEGQTLAEAIGKTPMIDPARARHISAQIAAALGAAHAVGIIHRDLKPDNVMLIPKLGDNDFVKLLDFGLAKILADSSAQQLTAVGVVLGTPQYMSPEACESKTSIDSRADIYSLGVLMFQMMTGVLPFDGAAMGEILVKHVTQPPPAPRGINPNIPPATEQVILRCLSKLPDARFPTMGQLRDAILDPDRYLSASPPVVQSSALAGPEARTLFNPGAPLPAARRPRTAADAQKTVVGKRATGPAGVVSPTTPPSANKTAFLDPADSSGAPPLTNDAAPAPQARTAFMEDGARPAVKAPPMPDMPQPQPATNRTMVIGTPHGYSNAPPPSRWPLVVVLLLVLGGGSAAITLLVWGGGSDRVAAAGGAGSTSSSGENGADPADSADSDKRAAAVSGTASGADDAGTAEPEMAKITLTSNPSGATIVDADENRLGVTPAVIKLASNGAKHVLELRHPRAKTRKKTLLVTGDVAVSVQMELLDVAATDVQPVAKDEPAAGKDEPSVAKDKAFEAKDKKRRKKKREKKRRKRRKNGTKDNGVITPDFD